MSCFGGGGDPFVASQVTPRRCRWDRMASSDVFELTTPRSERTETESLFDQVVSPRTLNMVALTSSVLWLLGMLSSITRVADQAQDPAVWDYVAATNESTGFLVVTVLAWVGAAIVDSVPR